MDNKRKTVKPLLYDKVADKGKIHLIENNGLVKTDLETAEVLNNIFNSTEPCYLKIFKRPSVSNTNNDATFKAILKKQSKNPSIIAIQNICKVKGSFDFIDIDQKQTEKDILKLGVN